MKLLLYCTKANPNIVKGIDNKFYISNAFKEEGLDDYKLNGKIVAECDFEVEKIRKGWGCLNGTRYSTSSLDCFELYKKSYLSFDEINNYLKGTLNEYCGYAIHIKNLKIFDEPRELSDYTTRKPQTYDSIICDSCNNFGFDCKKCSSFYDYQQVMKAPQNMMKVCEWDVEDKILISIQPQWLCKILNKEKTIEIRKKVLKEMMG